MFQLRLIGRVVLRLLLASAALAAAVQAFRLLLLPALAAQFQLGEGGTSVVRRIGVFSCALLAYWAYVRCIERRKVDELRPRLLAIALGGVSGAGLIALAAALLFAVGAYQVTAWQGLQARLLGVAGLIVIAAMLEELFYRGIIFRTLESAWGTTAALWLQSLFFGIGHIANIEDRASTAELVATVVSVTLLGALWTLVYVHTRSLWAAAANHAAWNFTIVLTGVPLSGLEDWLAFAPMASRYDGPAWLTGGAFGPEASVVTMGLVGIALVALCVNARKMGLNFKAQTPTPVVDVGHRPGGANRPPTLEQPPSGGETDGCTRIGAQ